MPIRVAGKLDAVQTQMRGLHMESKRTQIISGQVTKILVIVDDKHVKAIGLARRSAWCLGWHTGQNLAPPVCRTRVFLRFTDNFNPYRDQHTLGPLAKLLLRPPPSSLWIASAWAAPSAETRKISGYNLSKYQSLAK